MKKFFGTLLILLVVFAAPASSPASYFVNNHEIKILGTSNLHDWTADVPSFSTNIELVISDGKLESINHIMVDIDATRITGSGGNIMTRKIAETLKSNKNPRIVFRMTRVDNISQTGNDFTVRAAGILTLGGVSQPIDVVVHGHILPNGDVQFTGVKEMKMTTWQLDPPRAMMGAVRAADDIKVDFSITLNR